MVAWRCLDPIDEQQLSDLQRYGFDLELQRRWQRDISEGRLSKATNAVSGDLLVPPPGTVHKQPSRSTRAHRELEQLGVDIHSPEARVALRKHQQVLFIA